MFDRPVEQRWAVTAVLSDRTVTKPQDARVLELKDEYWQRMEDMAPVLAALKSLRDDRIDAGSSPQAPRMPVKRMAANAKLLELAAEVDATDSGDEGGVTVTGRCCSPGSRTSACETRCQCYAATPGRPLRHPHQRHGNRRGQLSKGHSTTAKCQSHRLVESPRRKIPEAGKVGATLLMRAWDIGPI
ncbi:hypothetical protein SKAU_G00261440 [Synaphobranchus kaupii]|uniref:Uncharacterized protein n=1 Tax=Synaphobranchus kaupii TaxID=118154 RepID=A0A9Q1EYP5_SYNKA|nr:hypothetical protein SKAU_G00261440 [Synaphobranchus kaupii]